MQVVESVSLNPQIGAFFMPVLQDYKKKPSLQMQNMYEEKFDEWLKITHGESRSQK